MPISTQPPTKRPCVNIDTARTLESTKTANRHLKRRVGGSIPPLATSFLAFGPDVWEIVKVLREIDERGPSALAAAAEVLALPEARVRAGMHYYAAYPNEVDAEIDEADRTSVAREAAWESEQRLLA